MSEFAGGDDGIAQDQRVRAVFAVRAAELRQIPQNAQAGRQMSARGKAHYRNLIRENMPFLRMLAQERKSGGNLAQRLHPARFFLADRVAKHKGLIAAFQKRKGRRIRLAVGAEFIRAAGADQHSGTVNAIGDFRRRVVQIPDELRVLVQNMFLYHFHGFIHSSPLFSPFYHGAEGKSSVSLDKNAESLSGSVLLFVL